MSDSKKTAEGTNNLVANKIADKGARTSKMSLQNNADTNE